MADDFSFDPKQSVEEQAARMVVADFDGLARRVQQLSGRGYGITSLTPEQERWAWEFQDESVDVPTLLASGLSPAEAASRRFPLQQRLMEQAGRSFDEQQKYAERMVERSMRAREQGRVLKPPPRQEGV
jgi:hypothetical protein